MMYQKMSTGILRILSRISEKNEGIKRILLPARPATRIAAAFLAILLSAFSRNAFFIQVVIAEELLRLAFLPASEMRNVIKTVLAAAGFTALLMLPAVFLGHPRSFLAVTLRVITSVLILANLNELIDWKEMMNAFRYWHIPELFIFTLATTIRFMVLLGRFSESVLEAIHLRSVQKVNWKNAGTGNVLGMTFLKSEKMTERTSEAMTCRCFCGKYPSFHEERFSWGDTVLLILLAVLGVFFIFCQKAVG